MLINIQSTLRVGNTLVTMIFMSTRAHLSNFACNKTEWPLYLTIGNLSSKIRQMTSMDSIIIVALLPISIKNCSIPQKQQEEQWETNWEALKHIVLWVLQPLTFKYNPSAESEYCNVLCADGNSGRCKEEFAAWLADCTEYSDLHYLKRYVSFRCECPQNDLRDSIPRDNQHPQQDHNLYKIISNANAIAADAEISSRHVHWGFNMYRHIPCILSNLPKPDIPHSMQLAMLDHLQK